MRKYYNRFWIIVTVVFCVAFILLFFPLALKRLNTAEAVIYTLIGLLVIWGVYFVRAYVFQWIFSDREKS